MGRFRGVLHAFRGATFDENSVPPWTRGDFRGVFERGKKPQPGAAVKASQAFTPESRVFLSAFPNPSRQPPEGCAFFPPLVRGFSGERFEARSQNSGGCLTSLRGLHYFNFATSRLGSNFTTQTSSIPFLRAPAERVLGEESQQESEGSPQLSVQDD